MLRRSGLLACAVIALSASRLVAQDQNVAAGPAMVVVHGLAPNDLLNIRATTSPTGILIGRVPNGTMLARDACETVNAYVWCKVTAANDPKVTGWTPQRYLLGGEPVDVPPVADPPVAMPPAPVAAVAPAAEEFAPSPEAEKLVAAIPAATPEPVKPPPPVTATVRAPAQLASLGMVALASSGLRDIRAATRPTGLLTGRIPTDMMMASTSCGKAREHDWCRVSAANEPNPRDWTPQAGATAAPAQRKPGSAQPDLASTGESLPLAAVLQPSGNAPSSLDDAQGAASAIASAQSALTVALAAHPDAAPVATGTPTAEPQQSPPDVAPASGGVPIPTPRPRMAGDDLQQQTAAEPLSNAQLMTATAPADPVVGLAPAPVAAAPTAAPNRKEIVFPSATASAPAVENAAVETLAAARTSVASPGSSFDAVDEIPCARYVGQPMMRCEAGVVRTGNGTAQVTVTWPDGGRRIIQFRDGKPELTNSRSELRFTREAELNMIRVGSAERFEIPDTLPFGD